MYVFVTVSFPDFIVAVSVTSVSFSGLVTFPSFAIMSALLEDHVIVELLNPSVGSVMSEVVFDITGRSASRFPAALSGFLCPCTYKHLFLHPRQTGYLFRLP